MFTVIDNDEDRQLLVDLLTEHAIGNSQYRHEMAHDRDSYYAAQKKVQELITRLGGNPLGYDVYDEKDWDDNRRY